MLSVYCQFVVSVLSETFLVRLTESSLSVTSLRVKDLAMIWALLFLYIMEVVHAHAEGGLI